LHARFILEPLPEDPFELVLSSGDELNATEPEEHESEQTLQSSNPHQGIGSSELPCTELCCSAGSEISQPTTPAILKKTEVFWIRHKCS